MVFCIDQGTLLSGPEFSLGRLGCHWVTGPITNLSSSKALWLPKPRNPSTIANANLDSRDSRSNGNVSHEWGYPM